MSSILLVDDRVRTVIDLSEALGDLNRGEVFSCLDIFGAIEKWGENKNDISHIITDLSMNPLGLNKKERKTTSGGLYTGWVWLWNYVIKDYDEEMPEKIFKDYNIIIFSEYINNMDDYKFVSEKEKLCYDSLINKIAKGKENSQQLLIECVKNYRDR
jgi:hypothetical protein